jgi:dipeptidyl aminopeptidase/acylaminoacyl peptidase
MKLISTVSIPLILTFFLAGFTPAVPNTLLLFQKTPVPRSLDPDGPWIIMHDYQSIMVANSDGTGLEQLFTGMGVNSVSLSPDSRTIALILDDSPMDDSNGLSLTLFRLPAGGKNISLPLQNPVRPPGDDIDSEPHRAIDMSDPAWSHDGKSIAFIAQLDGPSADLYRYDVEIGTVTRLSTEDIQAYKPSWSPDDRFIFYATAWAFGTGAGFGNAGSWFISRDGSQTIATTTKDQSNQVMLWVNPHMAVLSEFGIACGPKNIRLFNVDTGKSYSVWPDEVKDVAYSEATDQLALLIPHDYENCTEGKQKTGLYIMEIKSGNMREVTERSYTALKLDPSTGRDFLARNDSVIYRVDAAGNVEFVDNTRKSDPEYSEAAGVWLWYKRPELYEGIWVGKLGETPHQVYEHPIGETSMTPGGKSIYFMEMGIGRLYRADAPDFDPVSIITSDKLNDGTFVIYADPTDSP